MDNNLAVSLAQAIEEIRRSLVWFRSFAERMAGNDRNQVTRWKSSTPGVRSFNVDFPVKYWTVYVIALTGSAVITASTLGDAPEPAGAAVADEFAEYGPGTIVVGIGIGLAKVATIRNESKTFTVRLPIGTTAADVVVIAHNGGVSYV